MQQLNLKPIYERLSKDRLILLLRYIFKVQGLELKRLDYNAAAREFNLTRAQIARDVTTLRKADLIIIEGDKLRLNSDIVIEH
jgi:hypothetical protein